MNRNRKTNEGHTPAWWALDSLVALMVGIFFTQRLLPLSHRIHEMVMIGIVFIGYGLMWLWLWVNRVALRRWDEERAAKERKARAEGCERPQGDLLTPVQAHYREVFAKRARVLRQK